MLLLGLGLNLKSYMDLLLIWGPIYPQNIILPIFYMGNEEQRTFFLFVLIVSFHLIVQRLIKWICTFYKEKS